MASLIGFEQPQVTREAYLNTRRMLAVGTVSEFVDDRPPVEAAPEFYDDVFAAPFTLARSQAPGSANYRDGKYGERCQLRSVECRNEATTKPRIRGSIAFNQAGCATSSCIGINDLAVYMGADAIGGFASAEFAITLRVFDGERVVATRRVPAEQFAATIVGFNRLNRRFPPMTLGCEFERGSSSDSGGYLMVVEFETIASSVGIGNAQAARPGELVHSPFALTSRG